MQRYQGPVFCQRKVDKKTKHLIDQYFVLWSNWIAIANNTTKVRYECFCFTVVVRILRWFTSTCYITRRFIRLPTCKCTCKYGKRNDLACLYWVSRVAMKTWTSSVVNTPFYSQQMLINGIQPNLWPTFAAVFHIMASIPVYDPEHVKHNHRFCLCAYTSLLCICLFLLIFVTMASGGSLCPHVNQQGCCMISIVMFMHRL